MYFMIFSNIIGWQFICVCSFTYGGEYLLLVFPFTTLELDFRREAPMDKKGLISTCRKGFLGEFRHLIELSVQIAGWC